MTPPHRHCESAKRTKQSIFPRACREVRKRFDPQIARIFPDDPHRLICVNLRNLRIDSFFGHSNEKRIRKKKKFFFEKKNQKTFAPLRAVLKQHGTKAAFATTNGLRATP
jgi:hypothetical protein